VELHAKEKAGGDFFMELVSRDLDGFLYKPADNHAAEESCVSDAELIRHDLPVRIANLLALFG